MERLKVPRAVAALLGGAWLLVGLQVFTGVALSGQYKPGLEAAHASVEAISRSSTWGFVAGFHYWASAALIVSVGVACLWMLLSGAVRRDTKSLWWCALVLLVLVVGLQITGNALPASQHDVRTVNIEAGIIGGVPGSGPALRSIVLGGDQFAQATLDRWYGLHRVALTAGVLLFTLLGLLVSKRMAVKIPVLGALAIPVVAILLTAAFGLPLGARAGEEDFAAMGANPMWYVYPNHAMLVLFGKMSPGAQWIGAILVPLVGLVALLLLPVFSKDGKAGKWIGGLGMLCIVIVCGLAGTPVQSPFTEPTFREEMAQTDGFGEIDEALAGRGELAFDREGCLSCHRVGARGQSDAGPNLAGVGSRQADPQWYVELLKDPASKNRSTMPAFDDLPEKDLRALAEYLRSLKWPTM